MKLFQLIGLVSSECADFENDRDFVTCKELAEESLLRFVFNRTDTLEITTVVNLEKLCPEL